MRIIEGYVEGYKPLATYSNINAIRITTQHDITVILGTNGCGKSMLLKELTPFPAIPGMYYDGGIKHIWIEHNGSIYELISYLSKGKIGRHTFIKDDVTIHEKATAALHRELVIKEFGYTPLVHRLLIGDLKFTDMLPAVRKDILTMISPLDLDYAISLHGDIKGEVRDATAVVKHLTAKGTDIKVKLQMLPSTEGMAERKVALEEEITSLLPFSSGKPLPHPEKVLTRIDEHLDELHAIRRKAMRVKHAYVPDDRIDSTETLNEFIGMYATQASTFQEKVDHLTSEIEALSGVTSAVLDNHLTPEELKERYYHIQHELDNLATSCYVENNHMGYVETLNDIQEALEIIYTNCEGLRHYDPETRNAHEERYRFSIEQRSRLQTRIDRILSKMTHLQDQKEENHPIDCPQCQLNFIPGQQERERELESLREKLAEEQGWLQEMHESIKEDEPHMSHFARRDKAMDYILEVKRRYLMPMAFWDAVGDAEYMLFNPSQTLGVIGHWRVNIESGKHRSALVGEFNACQRAIAVLEKYGTGHETKLDALQGMVVNALEEKWNAERNLDTCKEVVRAMKQYTELYEHALSVEKNINHYFQLAMDAAIYHDAKERSTILYNQIAEFNQALSQSERLTHAAQELEEEYNTMVRQRKGWSLLEEHLSPVKGLIADQMLGFITSYTTQINKVSEEIWEYPLEVDTCNMDNGTLDYQFPLIVDGEPLPDISNGSTAQKDLVNLTFMIVMRHYLGITDYPLYLDETGASFDDQHRSRLINYIKTLIHSRQCSQIFMVNHYACVHGGLSNNSIVVIDSRNVTLPEKYNENVEISYRG